MCSLNPHVCDTGTSVLPLQMRKLRFINRQGFSVITHGPSKRVGSTSVFLQCGPWSTGLRILGSWLNTCIFKPRQNHDVSSCRLTSCICLLYLRNVPPQTQPPETTVLWGGQLGLDGPGLSSARGSCPHVCGLRLCPLQAGLAWDTSAGVALLRASLSFFLGQQASLGTHCPWSPQEQERENPVV